MKSNEHQKKQGEAKRIKETQRESRNSNENKLKVRRAMISNEKH